MDKEKQSPRTQHQIFLEDKLWKMARILSRKYTSAGKPICGKHNGSASWYIRNALLAQAQRDGAKIDLLELTDCKTYQLRK